MTLKLKKLITLVLVLVLVLVTSPALARHRAHSSTKSLDPDAPTGTIQIHNVTATVAFSPRGQAQDLVVNTVASAKKTVLVQAYGFSNTSILKALVDAKARGVDVRVILDKSNDKGKYSGATYMVNAGIPVWIDYKPAIAHNKVMIIDGQEVITGSFNFTEAAQNSNAENVLVLQGATDLAALYTKDWQWRLGESRQYAHQ